MKRVAWRGALLGATTTLLLQLPVDATYGLIAFAALGPACAPIGIASALLSTVLAQWVGHAAGSRHLVFGPRAGSALIVAALVLSLQNQPAVNQAGGAGSNESAAVIMALVALTMVLSGVLQLCMGLWGLGNLAKSLPLPVRAGFLTGVGVLLIVSGMVMVLGGSTVGTSSKWQALALAVANPAWAAVSVGLLACVITALPAQRLQIRPGVRVPPPLLGFLAALLLHFVWLTVWPGAQMGLSLGMIGAAWQPAAMLASGAGHLELKLFLGVLPLLLGSAVALAVLSAVETSFASVVVDGRLRYSRNGHREALAQGLSNIVCGAAGAQPSSPVVGRSMVLIDSGGTWAGATVLYATLVATVALAWPAVLQWLPLSAVGGGLMGVGLLMLDRWTLRNLGMLQPSRRAALGANESRALLENLVVTLGVAAAILVFGLVWGVLLGVFAAMVLMVRHNSRSLVRSVQHGDTRRSKKVRLPEASVVLDTLGRRVVLIELQGMIFFGTATQLAEQVRSHSQSADWVVLAMQRVSDIDATGARTLLDLAKELSAQEKMLIAADLASDDNRLHHLKALGWPQGEGARLTLWADADQALQWAEDWLLRDLAPSARRQSRLTLADTELAAHLTAQQVLQLRDYMTQHPHDAGSVLFNVGDVGDALYVSLSGDIALRLPGSARRLASFAPGVVVGGLALIDASQRSEQAVAETHITVLRLDRQAFDRMHLEHPALWDAIMRNLGIHLAVRLRSVTSQLAAAAAR